MSRAKGELVWKKGMDEGERRTCMGGGHVKNVGKKSLFLVARAEGRREEELRLAGSKRRKEGGL